MAGFDVAAELEALLSAPSALQAPGDTAPAHDVDVDTGVYLVADNDLLVADVEESDLPGSKPGQTLNQELQAQLNAFDALNGDISDDEFAL